MTHTWAIARGAGTNVSRTVIVELTGADGTVGLGEAAPIARYRESLDTVEAFLKKVDARGLSFNDVEGSMSYLDTLSPHDMSAKCAINIALLDGAAKRARKPIYDYLELGFPENQHISSFTIGIDKPEVIRKKVLEAEQYPCSRSRWAWRGTKRTCRPCAKPPLPRRFAWMQTKAGRPRSRRWR